MGSFWQSNRKKKKKSQKKNLCCICKVLALKSYLLTLFIRTIQMSLTRCQSFSLSGGYFVDAALFVDKAALNHFEV